MANPREKFQALLRKLFQFDCAELDFGIYRIMNQKRDVIERFIKKDLLDGVAKELMAGAMAQESGLAQELAEVSAQIKENFGDEALDAEGTLAKEYHTTPRGKQYLELRDRASSARSSTELESEIFNHLYTFFNRYYDEGDFMSLRRYSKRDKYAIPYNGEEVHLHWANADQYYIKTGENFTDYSYKHGGWTICFKLRNASVEQYNVKGAKRFFFPRVDDVATDKKACIVSISFEYRPMTSEEEKRKLTQEKILDEAYPKILAATKSNNEALAAMLHEKRKDSDGDTVTLLEHHLMTYTRKNSTDFFIHKDLKGFLERELDFYIKNEILNIDEIEAGGPVRAPRWFQLMATIRAIGHKIIVFLAQIEEFQKRIFEKKKFVTEVNYCITLDRVPESLYPVIIKSKAQIQQWKLLFGIEDKSIKSDFLRSQPYLTVDTKFFDDVFKDALLASLDDFDSLIDGVIIKADNFQALNFLFKKCREQVKCIYIDPPYNTDGDDFVYKDNYKDSSWITMMDNRLHLAKVLLNEFGSIGISIDDNEAHNLNFILNKVFDGNKVGELSIIRAEGGGLAKQIVKGHDYLFVFCNDLLKFPPLLRPKDIRGEIVEWKGKQYWVETDWLRTEFGKYGTLFYEDIAKVKGVEKKREIDDLIKTGEYRLIKKEAGHIVGRLRPVDEDGSKFYSIVKHLNADGNNELQDLFPRGGFGYPKPLSLCEMYILGSTFANRYRSSLIVDFFAGSGTTAHAVINLNRADGGKRKYILIEVGEHFDTVLKPRIEKVIYSKDWNDGRPVSRKGSSHAFKYMTLESYEDALDNIAFKSSDNQDMFKLDDYILSYMLGFETKHSETLLNVSKLDTPFDYKLKRHGKDKALQVDLPETFNYLIGLHVDSRRVFENNGQRYLVYRGMAEGKQTAVIWRATSGWGKKEFEQDRDFVLREKFTDGAEDIFVNTDSFIPNARSLDPVFKHRMFNEE